MKTKMKTMTSTVTFVVAACLLAAGLAAAQEKPPAEAEARQAEATKPRAFYRLDYTVHELQDGKRLNSRSYTLFTDGRRQSCHMRVGNRVPITMGAPTQAAPPQFQYFDVGFNLDCFAEEVAGGLAVENTMEISSVAGEAQTPAPVVRSYRMRSSALLPFGKPRVVVEGDDPHAARRLQVEVTATRAQ